MAEEAELETHELRPMGQGGDEIQEISETVFLRGNFESEYEAGKRGWSLRAKPRTAGEARDLMRGHDDIGHRKLVTWAGVALIFIVTLAAVAGFLGMTYSTAQGAHEDAVRLLILIIGAVLGTVFGAVVVSNKDGA